VGGRAGAGDELGEPGRRADEDRVGVLGAGLDGVGGVERDVVEAARVCRCSGVIEPAGRTLSIRS
jgi:hypothetical protein